MDMIIFLLPIIIIVGLVIVGLIIEYGFKGMISYLLITLVVLSIGWFIIYTMMDAIGAVK